ncbi:hypothetical protein SAY87_007797 [Trapa incisa]|uniref:Uncharacterized protein n=1 Tax=Trapa incisa TaxID=236973 RepID=A0AAN7KFP5_9MYRT|nr:hypothetical protein SAY87_007797 [Trapa incisa]
MAVLEPTAHCRNAALAMALLLLLVLARPEAVSANEENQKQLHCGEDNPSLGRCRNGPEAMNMSFYRKYKMGGSAGGASSGNASKDGAVAAAGGSGCGNGHSHGWSFGEADTDDKSQLLRLRVVAQANPAPVGSSTAIFVDR